MVFLLRGSSWLHHPWPWPGGRGIGWMMMMMTALIWWQCIEDQPCKGWHQGGGCWKWSRKTTSCGNSTWLCRSCKQWLLSWLWKGQRGWEDLKRDWQMLLLRLQMPTSFSAREWWPWKLIWDSSEPLGSYWRNSSSSIWMALLKYLSDQRSNHWTSDHLFAGKWPTLAHEPGYIFVIGNVPLSGLVFGNWCLATTLGITFWVWCDLWRLHCGNSFNILQFIGSDIASVNKLVPTLSYMALPFEVPGEIFSDPYFQFCGIYKTLDYRLSQNDLCHNSLRSKMSLKFNPLKLNFFRKRAQWKLG